MAGPNIWVIDIETAPNLAYVWSLWDQSVPLQRLIESIRVMCFAAKRYGDKKVEFWSEYEHGHDAMINRAHEIMEDADIIVHYNGKRFDVPHLKREFLLAKMDPPSPFDQIDLLQVVRSNFKFASTKLDHVAKLLGVGGKVHHTGFDLWIGCMQDDPDAWKLMEKYNRGDVKITEATYTKLRGWMNNHPNVALYEGLEEGCPNCGSSNLQRRGTQVTRKATYWRFQCQDCSAWSKATKIDKDGPRATVA